MEKTKKLELYEKLEEAEQSFLLGAGWIQGDYLWKPGPELKESLKNGKWESYSYGVELNHAINIQKGIDAEFRRNMKKYQAKLRRKKERARKVKEKSKEYVDKLMIALTESSEYSEITFIDRVRAAFVAGSEELSKLLDEEESELE